MKKIAILSVLVLGLAVSIVLTQQPQRIRSRAAVPQGTLPWLETEGNQIITAGTHQPVILRGANVIRSEWDQSMNWESRAIPEFAQNWNGNIVVRGFASDPVNAGDATYLNILDQHVTWSEQYHFYIVFVWRSFEPDGPQPEQPDAGAQSALVKLATRYKGNPNVIYGLQVEPHDISWNTLRPKFETIIDAIRAAAAPYVPLIMVPGSNWSQDVSGAITNPVNRPNIVYKAHGYHNSSYFQSEFGQAHDAGLPVFIGEFGPVEGATITDSQNLIEFTHSRGLGWAAWWLDWAHLESTALMNQSDLSPTSPWGTTARAEMLTTPPIPQSSSPTPSPLEYNVADINRDGRVNILDYVVLFENFGATSSNSADLNNDQKVNILDYVILFENFGKTN